MNSFVRIFLAPIVGFFTYYFCEEILRFTILREEDFDEPAITFVLSIIFGIIFFISIFIIQYKIIVPKTYKTIKRISLYLLIIGLFFCTLLFVGNLSSMTFQKALISSLTILVGFESYWFGNLLVIYLKNRQNSA